MPRTQTKSTKNRLGRSLPSKRFRLITFALLFGLVGTYLVFSTSAQTANPPFAVTCGYDVTIVIDTSNSTNDDQNALFKTVAKSFVNNLSGSNTRFMVVSANESERILIMPSGNTSAVLAAIDSLDGPGGGDGSGYSEFVNHGNPRSDKQNIFFALTDTGLNIHPDTGDDIKMRNGNTRMLAFVHTGRGPVELSGGFQDYKLAFGPKYDTGSIFTSDMIVDGNYNAMFAQLGNFARSQVCDGSGGGGGGGGGGDGGNGDGGSGTGTNGQGEGTGTGSGGGGGGSTANKQDDKPSPLPTSSGQGSKQQPNLNPSPFFDGRYYAPGSDPIDKVLGNITVGGKRIIHGWLYLLGLLVLIGVGGWLGWKHRTRLAGMFTSFRRKIYK